MYSSSVRHRLPRKNARLPRGRAFASESHPTLPRSVPVCIIGGGVTGAGIQYHLLKRGIPSLILEKDQLTSGATWHAAGLVTYFHGGNNFRLWHNYSVNLFKAWREEGVIHSFHTPGSMRLVEKGNRERLDEALHHRAKADLFKGLFGCAPMHVISPSEVERLHPLVDASTLECALYTEGDGHIDPSAVTNAFLTKARTDFPEMYTAPLINSPVVATTQLANGKWEVVVGRGGGEGGGPPETERIIADHVINCAGLWCRQVGAMAGVNIPAVVLQHQYLITEDIPRLKELHRERGGVQLPVLRDMLGSSYIRDERDGLLVGPYESADTVVVKGEIPKEWSYFLYDGDVDRLMPHLERCSELVPALGEAGLKTVLNGPTCWPADGNHLVGPSVEKKNYWLACAESYGIAHSGGLGKYVADWIADGEPPYELSETDPARYPAEWCDQAFVTEKVKETYGWNNHVHFPNENAPAARPVRSLYEVNKALYDMMKSRGCQFGFANGWEAPNYFDVPEPGSGVPEQLGNELGSYQRPQYCDTHVKGEVDRLLDHCGVLYWPFCNYEVTGPDAAKFLDRLVANNLPQKKNIALCHVLTPNGRVQSEITMFKISDNKYYMVSYPIMEKFDARHFEQAIRPGEDVEFKSVSKDWSVLMVNGPESQRILSANCTDDSFDRKWMGFVWREVDLFGIKGVRAAKVSFIGEYGWELHVPGHENAALIYKRLLEFDSKVSDWGGAAMNSFRMEKGIPLFGKDFTKDHSALEIPGLVPRFIKLDKPVDFTGKEALLEEQKTGLVRDLDSGDLKPLRQLRLMEVHTEEALDGSNPWSLDGAADCVGNEPLYNTETGEVVGFTTSGAYGFVAKKSVAMGYVPMDVEGMKLSVDVLGKRFRVTVRDKPFVEPWAVRQKTKAQLNMSRDDSAGSQVKRESVVAL